MWDNWKIICLLSESGTWWKPKNKIPLTVWECPDFLQHTPSKVHASSKTPLKRTSRRLPPSPVWLFDDLLPVDFLCIHDWERQSSYFLRVGGDEKLLCASACGNLSCECVDLTELNLQSVAFSPTASTCFCRFRLNFVCVCVCFQPPPAITDKQLDEREHTVEEWKGRRDSKAELAGCVAPCVAALCVESLWFALCRRGCSWIFFSRRSQESLINTVWSEMILQLKSLQKHLDCVSNSLFHMYLLHNFKETRSQKQTPVVDLRWKNQWRPCDCDSVCPR